MSSESALTRCYQPSVRLSESRLWALNRDYYVNRGPEAWLESDVPCGITTNPYIAGCFGELLHRLLRELGATRADLRVTIVELGAGVGVFAHRVLAALSERVRRSRAEGLPTADFRYVMTDMVPRNLAFWRQAELLRPYVEDGRLDFAYFDGEEDTSLHLMESGDIIDPARPTELLVVLANYVFDAMRQDAFEFDDMGVSALHLALRVPERCDVDDGDPAVLAHLQSVYERERLEASRVEETGYYDDPALDPVLGHYAAELHDTVVLMPVGVCGALRRLRSLAKGLLVVASDKGYGRLQDLEGVAPPEPDLHGSFSLMVNFDALARFTEALGGRAWRPAARDGVLVHHMLAFDDALELRETGLCFLDRFDRFSPGDYFALVHDLSLDKAEFDVLAALLRLGQGDPFIFHKVKARLRELSGALQPGQRPLLRRLVLESWRQHSIESKDSDEAFDCGLVLYDLSFFEEALSLFEQSLLHDPDHSVTYYNIALCHQELHAYEEAVRVLELASELAPEAQEVQRELALARRRARQHRGTRSDLVPPSGVEQEGC